MLLTYRDGKFVAQDALDVKDLLKEAGFKYNGDTKEWWTVDYVQAKRFLHAADDQASFNIYRLEAEQKVTIAQSWATDAEIIVPTPEGCEYLGYQKGFVRYWLNLPRRRVLGGDEMGLGKTIEFCGGVNAIARKERKNSLRVLIVCPAALRLNWLAELQKWLLLEVGIDIATGSHFPNSEVVIISYEMLSRWSREIRAQEWDVLGVDECHLLRNTRTTRSKEVLGTSFTDADTGAKVEYPAIPARWTAFLTGTPLVNRPREMWAIAHYCDPDQFNNFVKFGVEHCAGKKNKKGKWSFQGASNLEDLQAKCRSSFMIRRLKADVLKELPAKRRQVIELPIDTASEEAKELISEEMTAFKAHESKLEALRQAVTEAEVAADQVTYQMQLRMLKDYANVAFKEMSRYRKATALAAVPAVIVHLEDILEQNADSPDYKVLVFCHHHEVANRILDHFSGKVADLMNAAPDDRRALLAAVKDDPNIKLVVASIQTGVGYTATFISHVVFAEGDWVPGNISQAEDRVHRIGQLNKVLIQHLVLVGSLGARMAHKVVAKQIVIDKAMNDKSAVRDEKATFNVPKTTPVKKDFVDVLNGTPTSPDLTPDQEGTQSTTEEPETQPRASKSQQQGLEPTNYDPNDYRVHAVHLGMRNLAGMCDGAKQVDGAGFSKLDVSLGHNLARAASLSHRQAYYAAKLCVKYKRQLGQEYVNAAKSFISAFPLPKKEAKR